MRKIMQLLRQLFARKKPAFLVYSCRGLSLQAFIDAITKSDYSGLILSGKPDAAEVKRAWETVLYDFDSLARGLFSKVAQILKSRVELLKGALADLSQAEQDESDGIPLSQQILGAIDVYEAELLALDFYERQRVLLHTYFEIWLLRLSIGKPFKPAADYTVEQFLKACEAFVNKQKPEQW